MSLIEELGLKKDQLKGLEKALRGGDQNTKNKAQSIENTGHEGGDQKALRGEHANPD